MTILISRRLAIRGDIVARVGVLLGLTAFIGSGCVSVEPTILLTDRELLTLSQQSGPSRAMVICREIQTVALRDRCVVSLADRLALDGDFLQAESVCREASSSAKGSCPDANGRPLSPPSLHDAGSQD